MGTYDKLCSLCRIGAAQAVAGGLTTYHCDRHGVCDVPPEDLEITAVACRFCGKATAGPPGPGPYCCKERKNWVLKTAGYHPIIKIPEDDDGND